MKSDLIPFPLGFTLSQRESGGFIKADKFVLIDPNDIPSEYAQFTSEILALKKERDIAEQILRSKRIKRKTPPQVRLRDPVNPPLPKPLVRVRNGGNISSSFEEANYLDEETEKALTMYKRNAFARKLWCNSLRCLTKVPGTSTDFPLSRFNYFETNEGGALTPNEQWMDALDLRTIAEALKLPALFIKENEHWHLALKSPVYRNGSWWCLVYDPILGGERMLKLSWKGSKENWLE